MTSPTPKLSDILELSTPSSLTGQFESLNSYLTIIGKYDFIGMARKYLKSQSSRNTVFKDSLTILIHTSRLCQMIIVWSHLCGVHLSPLEGIRKEIRGWILYRMRIGIEQIDNGTRYSLHDPLSQTCERSSSGIMPGKQLPPRCFGVTGCSQDDFTSQDRNSRDDFFGEIYCSKSVENIYEPHIQHLIDDTIAPFIREAMAALTDHEKSFAGKKDPKQPCKDPIKYWFSTLPHWFERDQWMEVVTLLNGLKSLSTIPIDNQTWEPKVKTAFSTAILSMKANKDAKLKGKKPKGDLPKPKGEGSHKNSSEKSKANRSKPKRTIDEDDDDNDEPTPTYFEGIFMNGLASALEALYPEMVRKKPEVLAEVEKLPQDTWNKMQESERHVLSFMDEIAAPLKEYLAVQSRVEHLKVWVCHMKYCFCINLGFLLSTGNHKRTCHCPFSVVNKKVLDEGNLYVHSPCAAVGAKSSVELIKHMEDQHAVTAVGRCFNGLLFNYLEHCYSDLNGPLNTYLKKKALEWREALEWRQPKKTSEVLLQFIEERSIKWSLQVDDVSVTNTCPNDTILMTLFMAFVQNRIPNQVIENELSDIFVVMALLLHRHTDIARLKSLEVVADDIKKATR
eukprot:scaffold152614_cov80-Cyclotella_meneghiniana.AAC.3